jgi:hypothetical protein
MTQDEADARHKAEKSAEQESEIHRRKEELSRIEREEEARKEGKWEKKVGQGQSLGGAVPVKSGAERREEEGRGLTMEMRNRLERERRARAAEERMRRMQG